jgi:hypothetical protein
MRKISNFYFKLVKLFWYIFIVKLQVFSHLYFDPYLIYEITACMEGLALQHSGHTGAH